MYQSYVSQLVMELELRGYSPKTVTSYSRYLQRFLSHTNKSVSEINEDDLRYFLHALVSSKVSTSYVNSVYSATQLFFTHILKRPLDILHTWSQTLMFHPHLHCIIAGGGLSKGDLYFKSFKKKFFLHVKVLSAVFKGKLLEGLKSLYSSGDLYLPDNQLSLLDPDTFQSFLDSLYNKDWVVFSKAVFKCADHVIKYLGRYTHRTAISDFRIKAVTATHVSFSYLDNTDGGAKKLMTLTTDEFMRRFLLHVLPHKFVKIRHYGFLTNRFRSVKVALCRKLIAKQRGIVIATLPVLNKFQLLVKLIGKEKLCCPECGRYFVYNHEVNVN